MPAGAFVEDLSGEAYSGFNLLVSDESSLWYRSNRDSAARKLAPGIYGVSNHLLDTPWPKLTSAKRRFSEAINCLPDESSLFALLADDEIAYAGPLAARASEALVKLASHYHTGPGQILVLALVALHVLAIIAYAWRGHALVRPMISGDKAMTQAAAASRDTAGTRAFALVLLALSAAGVYAVVRWGGAASFG